MFRSIAEAKKYAVSNGTQVGYLALSTTYQEVDGSNDTPEKFNRRYDYMLIDLLAT